MIHYQRNPSIRVKHARHTRVETGAGGQVYLDRRLVDLLEAADGHTLEEILAAPPWNHLPQAAVRAAAACLGEAGLLLRGTLQPPTQPPPEGGASTSALRAPAGEPQGGGALVSAIVVTFRAGAWLSLCLDSILAQTYQPIECIVVDNASGDDTAQRITQLYPQVHLIRLAQPVSLAAAINRGAAQASGEYLLLLNQDIRLEEDATAELVRRLQACPGAAAAAPKLRLFSTPQFLNGIGNQAGTFSWGWDNGLGHLDLGQFDTWSQVPSACFAAAMLTRRAWQQVGALDEGYPLYYEDSDWSYRARLLGFNIAAAPMAVACHGYSQQSEPPQPRLMTPAKLRNVTYGRLRFSWKIFSTRTLLVSFPGFLLFELFFLAGRVLRGRFELLGAGLAGWRAFSRDIQGISLLRAALQTRRSVPDAQLRTRPGQYPAPLIWNGIPELTWDLVQTCYLPLFLSGKSRPVPEFLPGDRPRLLIVSNDIIDQKMAGTGARYYEIALALCRDIQVTLAVPSLTQKPQAASGEFALHTAGFEIITYQPEQPARLREAAGLADVVLASTFLLEKFPFLRQARQRLVIDLFDPTLLENLFYNTSEAADTRMALHQRDLQVALHLARQGDTFICANERQRDFWLGFLAAAGRVNPLNFDQDASLRQLITVVGTGISTRPPRPDPALLLSYPGISPTADLVLWGGGIWNWLDPLTLIEAWPGIVCQHPAAVLVFLGTRHPNTDVPEQQAVQQARAAAALSGELERSIFFLDWVPYEQRGAFLLHARLGVVLHQAHIETHFSSRTRVFDCIWAALPILISSGDELSGLVAEKQIGVVVPPGSRTAVEQAVLALLNKPRSAWAGAFEHAQHDLNWETQVAPLKKYCFQGKPAADLSAGGSLTRVQTQNGLPGRLRAYGLRAALIFRQEGLARLGFRLRRAVQARLARPVK